MKTFFNLNLMMEAPKASESLALISEITVRNQKVMNDGYAESIIAKLMELGSGEDLIDLARVRISSVRKEKSVNSSAC